MFWMTNSDLQPLKLSRALKELERQDLNTMEKGSCLSDLFFIGKSLFRPKQQEVSCPGLTNL